jgi:hypothetical protein
LTGLGGFLMESVSIPSESWLWRMNESVVPFQFSTQAIWVYCSRLVALSHQRYYQLTRKESIPRKIHWEDSKMTWQHMFWKIKLERSHPSNMPWWSSGQLDGEKEFEDLDLYSESWFLCGSNRRCMWPSSSTIGIVWYLQKKVTLPQMRLRMWS